MGKVIAVCTSDRKGIQKNDVQSAYFEKDWGLQNDAHAGKWHRQVSLLPEESVDTMRAPGLELHPGDFAENILTRGIALKTLPVGTRLRVGETVLEITQIGKQCHNDCAIKKTTGRCVMPTDGVFAVVLEAGVVRPGDAIEILEAET